MYFPVFKAWVKKSFPRRSWQLVFIVLFGFFVAGVAWYALFFRAPDNFPTGAIVTVLPGDSVYTVAQSLKKAGVIRSPFWVMNFIITFGSNHGAVEGDYYFGTPQNAYAVAWRVSHGSYGLAPIAVTVHEGSNLREAATIIKNRLPRFDIDRFIIATDGKEGYLFPDTYYFMPNVTVTQVVKVMEDNFTEKVDEIKESIEKFGKPLDQVVVMASIIEGEARQTETRRIISGILWKRIKEGMPLQVDAPFKYILGKGSASLTKADLKIDSPFNTYTNKGLPPSPISNPGLDALLATVKPITTSYYYFLTGRDGVMHYARTYEEHLANKNKYLR